MHDLGADAVMQICVGRQIFTEVRHPAAAAQLDHVLFDDLFEPVVGFRVGQVDHATVKLAKLNQIVIAGSIFRQITTRCGFCAQVFIAGNIGVDIGEELHAFFFPLLNMAIQLRIVVAVPLPVPHHALAKGSHADPGPVLRPDAVYLHARITHGVQFVLANLSTALNTERDAVVNPVRQLRLAT